MQDGTLTALLFSTAKSIISCGASVDVHAAPRPVLRVGARSLAVVVAIWRRFRHRGQVATTLEERMVAHVLYV